MLSASKVVPEQYSMPDHSEIYETKLRWTCRAERVGVKTLKFEVVPGFSEL